jgi:hypothetical protein
MNNCNVAWCYDLKAREKIKFMFHQQNIELTSTQITRATFSIKKKNDQYASVEMMVYCNHFFDTQTNESLSESIANVALKNICYSNSVTLFSRIALVIGSHNLGYSKFFHVAFEELEMS